MEVKKRTNELNMDVPRKRCQKEATLHTNECLIGVYQVAYLYE